MRRDRTSLQGKRKRLCDYFFPILGGGGTRVLLAPPQKAPRPFSTPPTRNATSICNINSYFCLPLFCRHQSYGTTKLLSTINTLLFWYGWLLVPLVTLDVIHYVAVEPRIKHTSLRSKFHMPLARQQKVCPAKKKAYFGPTPSNKVIE